jgi:hypothetical protein
MLSIFLNSSTLDNFMHRSYYNITAHIRKIGKNSVCILIKPYLKAQELFTKILKIFYKLFSKLSIERNKLLFRINHNLNTLTIYSIYG